jgi:acyl dehydratase
MLRGAGARAVYRHAIARTVAETDNLRFSALTHDMAWLHLDEAPAG